MLKTIIKLLVVYFVNKQLTGAKEGVAGIKSSMSDYAENRAEFVRDDFLHDLHRMLNTVLAYLFVFTALVLAGVIALLWIFAAVWESPNRGFILSAIIVGLLSVSVAIYGAIRYKWKNHYFMSNTSGLIAHDWRLFTNKLDSEANQ